MLILSGLNAHYGQAHIVRGVDLRVGAGECIALLGRNGAGKTTTLKAIIGLVAASGGALSFHEKDLLPLKNYRRARLGLGYVPEERRVFRSLTVREHLLTGERPARAGAAPWTIARVFDLFPKLGEIEGRAARHLSGGEQQMLTIARTLMGNPSCLLLDEPTEGLAPVVAQQVTAAVRALKAEGLAILMSEQNQRTAIALADRAYVLEKGQIIYEGSTGNLTPAAHAALGW